MRLFRAGMIANAKKKEEAGIFFCISCADGTVQAPARGCGGAQYPRRAPSLVSSSDEDDFESDEGGGGAEGDGDGGAGAGSVMPAARGSNGINASGDLAAATSAASSAREGNGRGGGKRREAPLEGKAGVCSEESHYFQDPYKRGLSAQFMEEVIAECQARCANPFGTCPLRPSCKLQMSSQPGGNLLVDFDHDKPVYKQTPDSTGRRVILRCLLASILGSTTSRLILLSAACTTRTTTRRCSPQACSGMRRCCRGNGSRTASASSANNRATRHRRIR